MSKKYSYKTIVSIILVISTILTTLSLAPKKVNAQNVSGYTTGISFNSFPQCDEVSLSTKLLFYGTLGALSSALGGNNAAYTAGSALGAATSGVIIDSLTKTINQAVEEATESLSSVEVHDSINSKKIDKLSTKTNEIARNVSDIKDSTTCTAAMGRTITKMLLQKITVSTVDWINSGFDGNPTFIQDPGKFFGNIAKNEVLQFGLEINDPELFPFGKAWLRNTAAAFNNKFQDNAQYSLDRLIKNTNPEYSAATFQLDFSQGGWNAWTAMTQAPQNNPLGFQLMADNELQRRLQGTVQSTADAVHEALSQANGFLGDQRCIDPEGVTKTEDDAGRIERSNHPQVSGNTTDPTGPNFKASYVYVNRLCNEWQYVTPGSMIADAATSTMETTKDSLLVAEDLNDAIAAVANALIARFSSDLMEKGFSNINVRDISGSSSYKSYQYQTQTQKDFRPDQLASSWLQANPDFNIRTDLTQALIDEQRTYSDKLKAQNKELLSTTDGKDYKVDAIDHKNLDGTITKVSNAYGLIPTIYQLDYCIPGPHPGWEIESREILNQKTSSILYVTKQSTILGSMVDGFLDNIPLLGDFLKAEKAINARKDVRAYYANNIRALTGYLPDYRDDNSGLSSSLMSNQGTTQVMNVILDRYAQIINKIFYSDPEILPTITKEATMSFNQLSGYNQMIKNNEDKIYLLKSTIDTLSEIKKAVSDLNLQYPDEGDIYENKLKAQIDAFGRLSASMVNGDDITSVDNLTKQIKDKKNYIYKNLLKGPYGCEAFLEKEENIKKFTAPWSSYDVKSVKRVTYPAQLPIIYNYNTLVKGAQIPDPWTDCSVSNPPESCKNTMPKDNMYESYGPGFLSFIVYSNDTLERQGSERLWVHDLFPTDQTIDGQNFNGIPVGRPGGIFEDIIGIY